MRYALLIYGDDAGSIDLSHEERAALHAEAMPAWDALFDELERADLRVCGMELAPRSAARIVRVRGGQHLVTSRPLVETREALCGLFLVDLPDLDEALRLAALVPAADAGAVEIRPLVADEV